MVYRDVWIELPYPYRSSRSSVLYWDTFSRIGVLKHPNPEIFEKHIENSK